MSLNIAITLNVLAGLGVILAVGANMLVAFTRDRRGDDADVAPFAAPLPEELVAER